MAFFGITIETIKEIHHHPDADRLEIASLKGMDFSFVVVKGEYSAGEKVLYFPVDSIISEKTLEIIGLKGKLSGENKNRVKSIKLRGVISQGIVAKLSLLPSHLHEASSEKITKYLEVIKFEYQPIEVKNASLHPLPDGYSKYDIEGADRFTEIAELLNEAEVAITEKLEGMNLSFHKNKAGVIGINMREVKLVENEGESHEIWDFARASGILSMLSSLPAGEEVMIYGELVGPGIMKNIYKLSKKDFYIFDVKINYKWLSFKEKEAYLAKNLPLIKKAPLLFTGQLCNFLGEKTIKEASTAKSVINQASLREGIVITPFKEKYHEKIGRLILKQRSPEYLVKHES